MLSGIRLPLPFPHGKKKGVLVYILVWWLVSSMYVFLTQGAVVFIWDFRLDYKHFAGEFYLGKEVDLGWTLEYAKGWINSGIVLPHSPSLIFRLLFSGCRFILFFCFHCILLGACKNAEGIRSLCRIVWAQPLVFVLYLVWTKYFN